MRREFEYDIPDGNLCYVKSDAEDGTQICVTALKGLAGEVVIPAQIEGFPVTEIEKKAFLSKKNLRKMTLPSSIRKVGDWAFAYCDNLHTVIFGGKEDAPEEAKSSPQSRDVEFGKSVFMECGKLRFLYLDEEETTAALLAAAVTVAEAPYLLDAGEAGSAEWLKKWDARMLSVLSMDDAEGYSKQVLCGEEDYGSTDLAAYESGRRRQKVRLMLLRLLYPKRLEPSVRERMEKYLREHTKGCAREETWQVVLREHGTDRAYYELFASLGCVTEENFDRILGDVGEEYPELRAYLMRYKEETLGYNDFFDELSDL